MFFFVCEEDLDKVEGLVDFMFDVNFQFIIKLFIIIWFLVINKYVVIYY